MVTGQVVMGVAFMAYAYLVFLVGQSKKLSEWTFYAAAFMPFAGMFLLGLFGGVQYAFGGFGVLIWIFVIVERGAWALTLKETSGKDRLVWFLIIYTVPLFGWLLYRLTEAR